MTRTGKNRLCIGITLLAVCALAFDRLFLGGAGPSEASAGINTEGIAARIQALTPTGLSIPELPFPRNLPPGGPRLFARDLFAQSSVIQTQSPGSDAIKVETASDGSTFASRHRLDAVISDGRFGLAVIDGTWVKKGQTVDGCTLIRVDGTRAFFRCATGETVLDVADEVQVGGTKD